MPGHTVLHEYCIHPDDETKYAIIRLDTGAVMDVCVEYRDSATGELVRVGLDELAASLPSDPVPEPEYVSAPSMPLAEREEPWPQ